LGLAIFVYSLDKSLTHFLIWLLGVFLLMSKGILYIF
jgi:hypothetical protein